MEKTQHACQEEGKRDPFAWDAVAFAHLFELQHHYAFPAPLVQFSAGLKGSPFSGASRFNFYDDKKTRHLSETMIRSVQLTIPYGIN